MKGLSILLASIVFFIGATSSAMHFNSPAPEDLRLSCDMRLKVMEKDLQAILKTSSYKQKYKKNVRAKRDAMRLSKTSVSEELAEIRAALETKKSMAITDCLLRTTTLLQKLNAVAREGHKNLDNFGQGWRQAFPNQVERLGN